MEDVGGQGFSVVGNAPLLDRLRRDVREGRLNHAYILDGAPGSGRHTLARWLCGAIACRNRPGQRTAADENQLGMFDSLPPVQPPAGARTAGAYWRESAPMSASSGGKARLHWAWTAFGFSGRTC